MSAQALRTGAPRWMKLALALSLAANVAVVGIVAGAALSRPGWHGRHGPPLPPELRQVGPLPFVVALAPEERDRLAEIVRSRAAPLRENRDELRDGFERMLELIRADTLDADALRAALDEQAHAVASRQDLGGELLIETLSGMSTEARRAYADRLDRSLSRHIRRE